jgi:hypothetical protein
MSFSVLRQANSIVVCNSKTGYQKQESLSTEGSFEIGLPLKDFPASLGLVMG